RSVPAAGRDALPGADRGPESRDRADDLISPRSLVQGRLGLLRRRAALLGPPLGPVLGTVDAEVGLGRLGCVLERRAVGEIDATGVRRWAAHAVRQAADRRAGVEEFPLHVVGAV
ncbi:MAG: hypothetical protein ACK559_38370, partial [bacterium]